MLLLNKPINVSYYSLTGDSIRLLSSYIAPVFSAVCFSRTGLHCQEKFHFFYFSNVCYYNPSHSSIISGLKVCVYILSKHITAIRRLRDLWCCPVWWFIWLLSCFLDSFNVALEQHRWVISEYIIIALRSPLVFMETWRNLKAAIKTAAQSHTLQLHYMQGE